MPDKVEACKAIAQLHREELHGKVLNVVEARERK